MTNPQPIEFWFDFVSPYAYLAWTQVHGVAKRHGREVEPRPLLFAGVLDHFGQLGPAEIAPKRMHAFKQLVRRAHDLGVPFAPPPAHPFNSLLGLRIASAPMPEAERREVIDVLFRAVWCDGPGIVEPAVVARVLTEAGLDAPRLFAAAELPETKARLRAALDEAIEKSIFGVPSFRVDGELFWGSDELPHLDRFLRGEDPVSPALVARWRDLPAQAVRPRAKAP